MLPTLALLHQRLQDAIADACGVPDADPLLVPASNPKFGDYQANACLPLAKTLQIPPRDLALRVAERLSIADICEPPTVAGPGFINLTLTRSHLEALLQTMHGDARLGVETTAAPRRAVVDFSSPNVAKDMHVGHLRSTILGDCLARVLEFLGHDVLRINHVGDWGTQFGMLITFLQDAFPAALTTADALDLGDLVKLYRQAKLRFDEDGDFRERSREQVVRLQAGEPDALHAWKLLCRQSRRAFEQIYALLDVEITERGESFYNPLLPAVVQDLQQAGLLAESSGALCVFVAGFTNREGEPQALIIRKSDGGYNYATTDLAALRYRIGTDRRDWLIYVVDSGQAAHFAQVFAVAEEAGWVPAGITLTHVPFGLVLGEDGKRLKTRSGENARLLELLDEAVAHARCDFAARLLEEGRDEPEAYKAEIARVLGIGAVKYADLSHNRLSNYAFQLEKMLALTGNTAPYLIYAYVRVQGISRKISSSVAAEGTGKVQLQEEAEISLAKHLVQLDVVLAAVADDLLPSRLCQHLFELSQKFNVFYENCPVLSAEPALRQSRLMLCALTAQTLKLGLSLLGIPVVERM